MTRTDLTKSMREATGSNFISGRQFKKWFRCGDAESKRILDSLDCVVRGKAKLYAIPDVADAVMVKSVIKR